jgi:hypothetical protein
MELIRGSLGLAKTLRFIKSKKVGKYAALRAGRKHYAKFQKMRAGRLATRPLKGARGWSKRIKLIFNTLGNVKKLPNKYFI